MYLDAERAIGYGCGETIETLSLGDEGRGFESVEL